MSPKPAQRRSGQLASPHEPAEKLQRWCSKHGPATTPGSSRCRPASGFLGRELTHTIGLLQGNLRMLPAHSCTVMSCSHHAPTGERQLTWKHLRLAPIKLNQHRWLQLCPLDTHSGLQEQPGTRTHIRTEHIPVYCLSVTKLGTKHTPLVTCISTAACLVCSHCDPYIPHMPPCAMLCWEVCAVLCTAMLCCAGLSCAEP
jgi:hypothetical protein